MNKNLKIALICLSLCVVIAIVPLIFIKDSEFGGADGAAEAAITQIDKDYKPWFESIFEPPGGETESLLFSLQAAIGAGVFGFGMGFLVARKKYKYQKEKEENFKDDNSR